MTKIVDSILPNSDTLKTFKNTVLKFLRPFPNSVFKVYFNNPKGTKFLTRICLGLNHKFKSLYKFKSLHKFKHNFKDSLHP